VCEQVCEELEAAQQGTVVEKEKMKTTWARRLANRTKDLDEKVEAADARAAQAERKLADLKVCECVCVCVLVCLCVCVSFLSPQQLPKILRTVWLLAVDVVVTIVVRVPVGACEGDALGDEGGDATDSASSPLIHQPRPLRNQRRLPQAEAHPRARETGGGRETSGAQSLLVLKEREHAKRVKDLSMQVAAATRVGTMRSPTAPITTHSRTGSGACFLLLLVVHPLDFRPLEGAVMRFET